MGKNIKMFHEKKPPTILEMLQMPIGIEKKIQPQKETGPRFTPEQKREIQQEARKGLISRSEIHVHSGMYNVRRDGSEITGPINRGFSIYGERKKPRRKLL